MIRNAKRGDKVWVETLGSFYRPALILDVTSARYAGTRHAIPNILLRELPDTVFQFSNTRWALPRRLFRKHPETGKVVE